MTTIESSIRQIAYPQQDVYDMLSNLDRAERMRGRIDSEMMDKMAFTGDTMTVELPGAGRVTLQIVERDEPKCIKMETTESPLPFNFWIQILLTGPATSKIRLTLKAELNPFVGAMVQKPLQETIEKIADALQAVDYSKQ